MTEPSPAFDQVNIVVRDMDATIAFYRRLGLAVPDSSPEWPPGSGARHVGLTTAGGVTVELDNLEMARIWHAGWRDNDGGGPVLGFSLPSRQAVDDCYADLTAAGHTSRQPPYDAFWGSRYAIVADPDGNDVGLMSPIDTKRRFTPEPDIGNPRRVD